MVPTALVRSLIGAWCFALCATPPALGQGDVDLQFPRGALDSGEPISAAEPITIRLDRLEVFADLGPGPGGRVPPDRLLLVMRILGEIDRLLAPTGAPSPFRVVALPPSRLAFDDRLLLPLPRHEQPILPAVVLENWVERVEGALELDLPEPDNPTGTYWPHRLYTIRVSSTLDSDAARDALQRIDHSCPPPSGWRPEASVDWNAFPLVIRGAGADPVYIERASADGRRFRVGVGLFLREEDARRISDSLSACMGQSLRVTSLSNDGRNLALVHGSRIPIP